MSSSTWRRTFSGRVSKRVRARGWMRTWLAKTNSMRNSPTPSVGRRLTLRASSGVPTLTRIRVRVLGRVSGRTSSTSKARALR